MQLDIAFSDHYLKLAKLKELGRVLKVINAACPKDDRELRHSAMLAYVSQNEPSILTFKLEPQGAARVEEVLRRLKLPPEEATDEAHGARGASWWRRLFGRNG
jgi:hypothetical protein